MKCSICDGEIDAQKLPSGEVYWTQGHNAEPINNGRCCTDCNESVVIHARLTEVFSRSKGKENGRSK